MAWRATTVLGVISSTAPVGVAQRQVENRGPLGGADQFFRLFNGRAFFQNSAEAEGIRHALRIEHRRAVARKEHFVDGQGQPGVVHARDAAEQRRKTDGDKGVFPLGAVDRDQVALVQEAQGGKVEVAAEQRAMGGAALGVDNQRGAGEAAAIDVGQQIAQQAHVAVHAQLLAEGPHLAAVIGRQLRRQRLAHFQALGQAVLSIRPLQQLPRIVDERLDDLSRKCGLLAADFVRRAGHDEHRQVVDIFQLAAAGPAFLETPRLLRRRRRRGQQENQKPGKARCLSNYGTFYSPP